MKKFILAVMVPFLTFAFAAGADAGIFGSHVAAYSAPVNISKKSAVQQVKIKNADAAKDLVCAGPEGGDSSDGSGAMLPEDGSGG